MAAPNFNAPRAARCVVDAAYSGDKRAAEKWGLSVRTVQRYRQRAGEDDELAALVAIEAQRRENEWAAELTPAISASADYLRRAAEAASVTDPDTIAAVGDALAKMAEVKIADQLIRSRIGQPQKREIHIIEADQ